MTSEFTDDTAVAALTSDDEVTANLAIEYLRNRIEGGWDLPGIANSLLDLVMDLVVGTP